MIALKDIEEAKKRLAGKVLRTPLFSSRTIGARANAQVYLKCEIFQSTGSFKARGALNKVLSLGHDERARGLITVSAGNHAQAVAWAARMVDAPCTVVMPRAAPQSKVEAVRGYGATIVFHDDNATLFDRLESERAARGATFIHPFDDPLVLAGAATVGVEIIEALPAVDVVLVPVGGGGLLAGVASAVKHLRPECRVIAVELAAGPGLAPALEAGKPVPVQRPKTLADGMTPPFVGQLPLAIARTSVDDIVAVSESEIVESMRMLMTRCKLYVEGAGAAATAALLADKIDLEPGAVVVAIVSGGNVDLAAVARLLP